MSNLQLISTCQARRRLRLNDLLNFKTLVQLQSSSWWASAPPSRTGSVLLTTALVVIGDIMGMGIAITVMRKWTLPYHWEFQEWFSIEINCIFWIMEFASPTYPLLPQIFFNEGFSEYFSNIFLHYLLKVFIVMRNIWWVGSMWMPLNVVCFVKIQSKHIQTRVLYGACGWCRCLDINYCS